MKMGTGAVQRARRATGLTMAVFATTAVVSGCGLLVSEPEPAAPTAKETLLASVPDGSEGPFRFTGKDATSQISGSLDHEAKAMEMATSIKDDENGFTMKMAFLVIGDDIWTKISFTGAAGVTGLPKFPKKWMKLDRSKLTDGESAPTYEGADPGNAGVLIQAATAVNDAGNGKYTGSIDVSSGEAAEAFGTEAAKALGPAARDVPFTATVGADNKLASLVLNVPSMGKAKAFQHVVTYQGYGAGPKLVAPTGSKAQDAPELAYEVLNG